MDVHGSFVTQVTSETGTIIRCAIKGRHSNSIKYYVWIEHLLSGTSVRSWYYQCKTGAETLGTCTHVATIVYFLSYVRYNDFGPSKGRHRIKQAVEEFEE